MASAAITNSRTIYDNFTTLYAPGGDYCGDRCTSYPVILQISALLGPGPYGTISFLSENETTAVGPNGFIM